MLQSEASSRFITIINNEEMHHYFICSHTGIGRLIISGEFEYPRGVATTKDDYILVLDSELGRVTVHNPSDGKILKTIQGMSHKTIQGM